MVTIEEQELKALIISWENKISSIKQRDGSATEYDRGQLDSYQRASDELYDVIESRRKANERTRKFHAKLAIEEMILRNQRAELHTAYFSLFFVNLVLLAIAFMPYFGFKNMLKVFPPLAMLFMVARVIIQHIRHNREVYFSLLTFSLGVILLTTGIVGSRTVATIPVQIAEGLGVEILGAALLGAIILIRGSKQKSAQMLLMLFLACIGIVMHGLYGSISFFDIVKNTGVEFAGAGLAILLVDYVVEDEDIETWKNNLFKS